MGWVVETLNEYKREMWHFDWSFYTKYWETKQEFFNYLKLNNNAINIPKCLWWSGIYQSYNDLINDKTIEDYTQKYTTDLHRKKSLNCKWCKYNDTCEGIHINFIRNYWFNILKPIIWKK